MVSYDPAFGYELALIVAEGIRRMYTEQEAVMYYLTVYNENYPMPPMPDDVSDGVLRGLYRFRASPLSTPIKGRGAAVGQRSTYARGFDGPG